VDQRATALARLFDEVPEGIYIGTLGAAGSVTLAANPHLKRIFGYAPDTEDHLVLPFDVSRFVEPHARTAFLAALTATHGVADHLLRLRRVDGWPMWIEVTAAAEPTVDAATVHIEALVRDVSERKKVDDRSRDMRHQLMQAEKMAALGQTISGVAHELNNPLATILSWAERLAERQADDKTRQGLEIILGESERAARIVRNLLTFARKRQTTRAMIGLNQVVRETLALRSYEQRLHNIEVVEDLAADLPQVFADSHQIKQVLLNLLINAEQALASANSAGVPGGRTPGRRGGLGGTIGVRTEHDTERGVVVLEVTDDGPGISEEVQGRIFDPFFTTKEVGKGTGLGLTVAYAIVQEHAGRISVRSSPGAGTTFIIELPVAAELLQSRGGPTAQQAISLEAFKGLRVLVVEDEPALAAAVAESLTDAGFVVDRAGDGEEGLTRLTEARYDLLICDLKMPRIDGVQFYRAMAAATPALARRVIFVTGDVAGTDAERFLEETGCRWLSKPFRLGDLLRAARDTLS
jgi:signal transduction histidine kinase